MRIILRREGEEKSEKYAVIEYYKNEQSIFEINFLERIQRKVERRGQGVNQSASSSCRIQQLSLRYN